MKGLTLETRNPAISQPDASRLAAASERPILVAVDLSRESEAALAWACQYARKVDAPLEILHVVHDPADSPGTYKPNHGDKLEPMADVAQRKLTEFIDRIRCDDADLRGLETAKLFCVPGLPGSTILQVARAHKAQHLVLGSRRREGLSRLFHTSIAGQIAGSAFLPVTFVRAED